MFLASIFVVQTIQMKARSYKVVVQTEARAHVLYMIEQD
jgi:hypothetical protein